MSKLHTRASVTADSVVGLEKRLRKGREYAGLSQREVAAEILTPADDGSFRHQTIYEWEKGLRVPDAREFEALRALYGVSGHWLLAGEGPMVPDKASNRRVIAMHAVLSATPEQLAALIELVEPSAAISGRANRATVAEPAASHEQLEAELRSTKEELERLQWESEELRERLGALEPLPPLTEEDIARFERAAAEAREAFEASEKRSGMGNDAA